MDLSSFDLNLLKTLLVLLQEKNTNKAAERLNTSQPAVSRSLAKMRLALNDPLFIRQARGLKLTPRAMVLALELPKVLSDLEGILQGSNFTPASLSGKFKIAIIGSLIESHGNQISNEILKQAPNIELELHDFSPATVSQLITGEMDAGLSFYPLDISKELRQAPVGISAVGGICRAGHPLAGKSISFKELMNYELAGQIVPEFNNQSLLIERCANNGLIVKAKFRSQQLAPILNFVEHSDSFFIAPKTTYDSLDPSLFAFVRVADENLPQEIKMALIYNSNQFQSAKFKWLESLMDQILSAKI